MAEVILGLPRMQEGITLAEVNDLKTLSGITWWNAKIDVALVERLLNSFGLISDLDARVEWDAAMVERFLNYLGPIDGLSEKMAIIGLSEMFASQPSRAAQIIRQPWFADGLGKEELPLLAALVRCGESQKEFDSLIQDAQISSRTVFLPLAGEVDLFLVRRSSIPLDDATLDLMEAALLVLEDFIGEAWPVRNAILYINPDLSEAGVNFGSHIEVSEGEDGAFTRPVLYHELAHEYWHRGPLWLSEGVASFLGSYTVATADEVLSELAAQRKGQSVETLKGMRFDTKGTGFQSRKRYIRKRMEIYKGHGVANVHEWKQAEAELTRELSTDIPYVVGENFFLGMYETLGHEATSSALQQIYLLLRDINDPHIFSAADEPVTEEDIYGAFLANVPPGKEDDFRDAWRRLHGGPIPGAPSDQAASNRAALIALYNATDGANWKNNTNWLSEAPTGEWHGVTADSIGRVTELNLQGNELSGEIPPELGSLVRLRNLYLSRNQLRGPIPAELGGLSNLLSLDLSRNQLRGPIPAELGGLSNLSSLDLSRNQLRGPIPADLGNLLPNLLYLEISGNQLTGPIQADLGQLATS